jgi:hypothetical protein
MVTVTLRSVTGSCEIVLMGVTLNWRRSSHCESNQCVDVAVTADVVLVRGTRDGPVLRFPPEAWRALCAALKNQEATATGSAVSAAARTQCTTLRSA